MHSNPPSAESIRTQVRKILSSTAFARSERLARFLNFTIEEMLEGRGEHLKEFVIGVEVFDKNETYDPRMDPIVRVEARRLREKLRKYYETEGRHDSLHIEFPTGSYSPVVQAFEGPPPAIGRTLSRENAIAVLPFANLSSEQENEYFSDGLTEELINALTKVEGLRVVAWSSAFQLKGKARDIRRIAEQLKVRAVLEGSVRRTEDRLRITAQLVDAGDGHYLWSESYERALKDVFAVQDEISSAIVGALRLKLAGPAGRSLVTRYTENLQAYHLYLKGRFAWNKRNEEDFYKALGYFEQAIDIDPKYAPAYAGMADVYIMLGEHGALPALSVMPKARAAATHALEIDPSLGEALVSLGSVAALFEWNWSAAEQYFRRGIERNPSYPTAHHWYGYDYLAPLGRLDEAIAELDRAHHLDPLSLIITTSLGTLFDMARQHERARAYYDKVFELDPGFVRAHLSAGRSYLHQHMHSQAVAAFEKARELQPNSPVPLALLAHAYNVAGAREEAERLRQALHRFCRTCPVPAYLLARAHLSFDHDRAFELLEQAFEERDPRLPHLNVSPIWDCLRADERFAELVRRIGLTVALPQQVS
ncbi:MAG TPA: FlgO family outer membrane protein [Bryobacteraceae bacterium]|nr:FlgO family outer membrane protein [Bryobacteraceae bacterium]